MNKQIAALIAAKNGKLAEARSLIDAAEAANRDLSEAEQTQFESIQSDVGSLTTRIERLQAQELAEAQAGSVIVANPNSAGAIQVGAPERHRDASGGFQSLGEFARAVVTAATSQGHNADQRLFRAAAPSTGMRESVGADGGYLVPPEFSTQVWQLTQTSESILPMTENTEVTGNSMSFIKDVSTRWGTDGVQAYWQGELTATTATKPVLQRESMQLEKLMVLVPVSEEMIADAAALNSYLQPKMAEKIVWKYEDAFFHGSGAGVPKGFMAGGGLVTVTKDAGHTYSAVAAVSVGDLGGMMARVLGYQQSVWMIHQSLLTSLIKLQIGDHAAWTPPTTGIAGAPLGFLFGRPILPKESCKAPLVVGDIVLANWKGYRTITKAGGLQTATSMHLYFDADATAFRVTFRVNGQPLLGATISPANGNDTLSHFVVLDDSR